MIESQTTSRTSPSARQLGRLAAVCVTVLPAALFVVLLANLRASGVAHAAGTLTVAISAGYNLVVDSNVLAPSTYAPSAATVAGTFCNTGDQPLTDVRAFIGDYDPNGDNNPSDSTPGLYPARDSANAAFIAQHPHLANTGDYAFTHIGGSLGLADARRYIGTLNPGECRAQYWHFTYPRRKNPDNTGDQPVWGDANNPNDDLWLNFDVWGASAQGSSANAPWKMTMRNEIAAMANKIYPNGSTWFNTNTSIVKPGDVITSNGVRYELGVINKGFDNDGDGNFDYNAWLQPVGDPSYDPSCFRLVRTTGVLTVSRSGGQPPLIITFTDQLYFTNLPPDNNGTIGDVYYTFIALNGPCFTGLSPYQEAASGADNEKFSGDYGTPGVPPVQSSAPEVTIDKYGNATITPGSAINYQIPFTNTGTADAGLPLVSLGGGSTSTPWMPVVISDSIPPGTVYVAGSATHTFTSTGVIILYSTDYGVTWTSTEPPASQVTTLQWWLTDTLKPGDSGRVLFNATVPATTTATYIENCAGAGFGDSAAFGGDCVTTLISGANKIGDTVWKDDDGDGVQDAGESGLANISVGLYLDKNGDGLLDSGDALVLTTTTGITGSYSFDNLPNGNFIVLVDTADADLPPGYGATTPTVVPVTGLGTTLPSIYLNADFGFGPALQLSKAVISSNPVAESGFVTYSISLINTLPGDGAGSTACQYKVWATVAHPDNTNIPPGGNSANAQWLNTGNALNALDGLYAATSMNDNSDLLGLSGFNLGAQSGKITKVEALLYLQELVNLKATDALIVRVYMTDTQRSADASYTLTGDVTGYFTQTAGSLYVLKADVTGVNPGGANGWSWTDFASNVTEMQLVGNKGGGAGASGDIGLDAAAFLVTTDQQCGGPENTIFTLPLTDTYDANRLQFVSASPAQTLTGTGVITWDDLGPLYPGQIKNVTLVFKSLDPGAASITTTNYVTASGAIFSSGRPVNNASDTAVVTVTRTAKIGDFIWLDLDGDGVQDGGNEIGLAGVTVRLCTVGGGGACGTVIATTTTDANGLYLFEGLADGSYVVEVDTTTLPGTSFTNTGDPDGTTNSRTTVTIAGATDVLTADFGYQQTLNTIYGNVWNDNDGDGTQQSGENGFSGVSVALDDCGADAICGNADDGATITVTTDANGNYFFEDLLDGNYRVRVITTTLPAGGTWTQTVDPDATQDSRTGVLSVSGGVIVGPENFAYTQAGLLSIGDTVYVDWDGDGAQDAGEEGIPNVTVYLYEDANQNGVIDATDALITSTTTNASGNYTFNNLAGSASGIGYLVVVNTGDPDLPAGYLETADPSETGVCATCDSLAAVTLTTSSVNTVDFGYHPTGGGSIGDFVWKDVDHDGIQDPGEPGIANVTLRLYEDTNGDGVFDPAVDAVISTTTTDANGNYEFTNLPYGPDRYYWVTVDITDTDIPTDTYGNPYVLSTNNNPLLVHLTSSDPYLDADFGFTAGGTIGDLVWRDDNRDGDPAGEPGLGGVPVSLYIDVDNDGVYSPGDTLVATTTTNASGYYSFTSLSAYTYVVTIDATGYPTVTYDLNGATDGQAQVGLRPGMIFLGADFGLQDDRGGIGDRLWVDLDGDDVYSIAEPGLPEIVITLTSSTGAVITTTTDNDGYYLFPHLDSGVYTVTYSAATIPAGLTQSFEGDGTLTQQIVVNLASGQVNLTADFAYVPNLNVAKSSIGSNNPLNRGDTLTYTVVVSNPSAIKVTNAALSDTTPANTTFVPGSIVIAPASAGVAGAPPTLVNPLTISANSLVTVTFKVTVASSVPASVGAITNTVGLTTPFINRTATATNPLGLADLSLTKNVSSASVGAGSPVSFTIAVNNAGPQTATGVTVSDTLPAGLTYVSSSATQGAYDSATKLWTVGTLNNGGAATLTLTATVGAAGTYTNTAEVRSVSQFDPDSTPNNGNPAEDDQDNAVVTSTSATPQPGVDLDKALVSSNPAHLTELVTYTIRLTNTGNTTLVNLPLTDTFDIPYLTFARAAPAPDAVNPNATATTGQLVWNDLTNTFGDLPPGGVVQVSVVMTATGITPLGTDALNRAVTANVLDNTGRTPPGGGDSDQVPVTILPNISLNKAVFASGPFVVGDEITFTIQITNEGSTTLVVLPLADAYDPAYLSFKRAIPVHNIATPGTITWNDLTTSLGDLPPKGSVSVLVVFDAAAPVTATVNMATVTNALDDLGNQVSAVSGATVNVVNPTAVDLLYFRVARGAGQRVELTWATAKEIDNYGFTLYRAEANDFSRAALIHFEPSALKGGSGAGAVYRYTDAPPAGGVWWYWLGDVDTQGRETIHAPTPIVLAPATTRLYLPFVFK